MKVGSWTIVQCLWPQLKWVPFQKSSSLSIYDKVIDGGLVVLDDCWRWPGCREAITDYLKEHQIQGIVLKQADLHGVYSQESPRCRQETVNN